MEVVGIAAADDQEAERRFDAERHERRGAHFVGVAVEVFVGVLVAVLVGVFVDVGGTTVGVLVAVFVGVSVTAWAVGVGGLPIVIDPLTHFWLPGAQA